MQRSLEGSGNRRGCGLQREVLATCGVHSSGRSTRVGPQGESSSPGSSVDRSGRAGQRLLNSCPRVRCSLPSPRAPASALGHGLAMPLTGPLLPLLHQQLRLTKPIKICLDFNSMLADSLVFPSALGQIITPQRCACVQSSVPREVLVPFLRSYQVVLAVYVVVPVFRYGK